MAALRKAARQVSDERLRPTELGFSNRRDQRGDNGDADQPIALYARSRGGLTPSKV